MSAGGERRYAVAGAGLYLKLTPEAVRKRGRRNRRSRGRSAGFRTERNGRGPCVVFINAAFFPDGKEVDWLCTGVAAKLLDRKRNTLTKQLNDHSEELADGMIIARLPGVLGCMLGGEWRVSLHDATEPPRV